jgi:uncharacterized protein (TIGR02646 family)
VIKISKPPAPAVLQRRGRVKQAKHCADYDRAPADYDAGTKTFAFDAVLYGHTTVKQALIAAQHGKCCFCERKIGGEGDVEHFRPKASFCQGKGFPLERPGYYWLAYDWDNLLLACPICNQRFKKNYFPLADPAKRARNHRGDLAEEKPLFINPAEEDPARFIAFRQEIAYAIHGNRRAKETIRELGLNRENLSEERRDHLDRLIFLRQVLDLEGEYAGTEKGRHILKEARAFLQKAILDSAKFTAMARAAAGE